MPYRRPTASLSRCAAALAHWRPVTVRYSPPIWRRSHPRWQGVPPVPNSNSAAISVTDAEFFYGMRFAGTGWPGTHGPWLVSLALSGCALEDDFEAVEPSWARLPRTALEFTAGGASLREPGGGSNPAIAGLCSRLATWSAGRLPARAKVLMCWDVRHWAGTAPGATVNAWRSCPAGRGGAR
jgi:hypothetical protein